MKGKEKNKVFILILLALFVIVFYNDYNTSVKLSLLNDNINVLRNEIDAQNVLLSSKIKINENELKQNKEDFLDLIEATQSDNQQKLDDLKSDVESSIKGIKVDTTDFSAIIDEVLQSVVSVLTNKGQGSGVFLRTNGHIVTNYHVIKDANLVYVTTHDKKNYNAQVLGFDVVSDIALLKINIEYPHLKTIDSDELQVGERVIALGNPGGLSFSVTEGIVSATNRIVSANNIGYIQTDVPISPGNSGGPLVNKEGKIIGLNNFKITGPGFEGLGFAIPSEVVNDIVNQIMDDLDS